MAEPKKIQTKQTPTDMLKNRNVLLLLEKLGFSRNEVKCYLASLTLGQAKISEMARIAGVNRVNAYGAVKALVERGLIEQEITKNGRVVRITPMENLQELGRQYQKRATKLRWKIEDLAITLLDLSVKDIERPRLLFFEESAETWRTLYSRSLSAKPGSEILFIGSYLPYVSGKYDEWYIPERLKHNVSARFLSHKNPAAEKLASSDHLERRETRFLPAEIDFPSIILIYNNEVSLLWESGAGKTTGVVIQGNAVVGVMKALFELAWQMAGPLKKAKNKK